jgi:hypothetical protein
MMAKRGPALNGDRSIRPPRESDSSSLFYTFFIYPEVTRGATASARAARGFAWRGSLQCAGESSLVCQRADTPRAEIETPCGSADILMGLPATRALRLRGHPGSKADMEHGI